MRRISRTTFITCGRKEDDHGKVKKSLTSTLMVLEATPTIEDPRQKRTVYSCRASRMMREPQGVDKGDRVIWSNDAHLPPREGVRAHLSFAARTQCYEGYSGANS